MADLQETSSLSSLDASSQPFRYWLPSPGVRPQAILIALHTWSFDYQANLKEWLDEAQRRHWLYLQPNFRGPNWTPEACGSELAMRDIIDALDWALKRFDPAIDRIYLAGGSGGGHMAMQTAAHYPQRFTAVTSWCGISDLASWHQLHSRDENGQRVGTGYGEHIEKAIGGRPGTTAEIDRRLWRRSPIHHLHRAAHLPMDLNHGVHDGHRGSVPPHHTIRAFNVIADHFRSPGVSDVEIDQLWTQQRLADPQPQDVADDPAYGRAIYLRRFAGTSRLTIFDGGHEWVASAACHWLAQHTPTGLMADPLGEAALTANGQASAIGL